MLAWKKGLGVSNWDGIVSPAYSVFRNFPEISESRYLHYLLRTDLYISEFKRNSTGVIDSRLRLYPDEFLWINIILPPLPEQKQIATFLDQKTKQIDTLIEKKQKLIELLKEQRTAIINQSVTKGLDPNNPIKDSGIEWLGKIPCHWKFSRLGFGITALVPMRDKPIDLKGDIPWIRIEDYDGKYISKSKSNQGVSFETVKLMNLKEYPVGTVLCTCSCSFGTTMIVTKPMVSNQTFIGLVPKIEHFTSEFLYYLLQVWKNELDKESSGSIQQYLSKDHFKSLKVVKPPINEQKQIVEYLDIKTKEIDTLIKEESKSIILLKEYRTALVSEAVTGKVDLRKVV